MASSSKLASDNPHFFKVVLPNALNQQKLEIPKKFVREHGRKAFLNNQTCLKVADGREWNVGLTKSNGKVWFHHDLQKFLAFYSVGLEYFLVFRYESQSSSFYVIILDHTATEIEYPVKKILNEANEKVKMETNLDDLDSKFYPQDFKVGKVSFDARKPTNDEDGGRKLRLTASQQEKAMAKATAFQSTTLNPSFMRKMWRSHIHPGKVVHVSTSFAKMHLQESTDIILEVSDGRMWSGRCGLYRSRTMKMKAGFSNRWKKFARENNLQVGDVCVFEMIRKSSRRITFKVEIFRAAN